MGSSSGTRAAGRPRALRTLVALLGVLGLVALAPQLALADAPITGQVTGPGTGLGIQGATVNLYNASTGQAIGTTTTGSDGSYDLGVWPTGTYQVQFEDTDAGYGTIWYNSQPNQGGANPVTVGSTAVTVNQSLQADYVTGQLSNHATGNPLPGIEVDLLSGPNTVFQQATTDNIGDYSFGPIPPGTTYEVEFNPGGADSAYSTSYYGGASPTEFSVTAGQTMSGIGGQIQPDEVTGHLTERATGGALSGFEVELLSGSGTEVAQTTTDGSGNYSFSAIPAGTYEIEFNPGGANGSYNASYYGGSAPTKFTITRGQTTSGINGQLFTGGLVIGTVTNSAQQGVSGVQVQLTNVSTGNDYDATTGSGGTYALDGLPTGSYQVLFQPGYGSNYVYQYYSEKSNAAAAQAVTVTTGQTTSNINSSLATGATVSGQVTDAMTGAPVSNATVYVDELDGNAPNYVDANSATTDSNGRWSVQGLPTGTYQVDFVPPNGSNYAFQYYNSITGDDPPTAVTLTAGSTMSNINAALTMAGRISGTVKDASGTPLQNVEVEALDGSGGTFALTYTDGNGNYTLTGLSPSASYRVEFRPPHGSSLAAGFYPSGATLPDATPVPVTVGQTTPNIDETLGQGGSISGVVTDAATGYPLGGAEVILTDNAGDEIFPDSEAITEPDGTYRLANLPPGSYKVEFLGEGALGFQFYNDASTLGAANSVTVGAGQAVTGIDAALSEGGTLEGHVRDAATGQPIADANVEVVDASGNFLTYGRTDPNGYYEIPGLAPGSYYVQVFPITSPPNYEYLFYGGSATLAGATPVRITAGATTAGIDVALPRASTTTPNQSNPPVTPPTTPPTTTATATTTSTSPVVHLTQVISGPPTLSGGSVSGLGKGKPVVKFRLRSGSNGAPKLRSFKVRLPAGLAFVVNQLRNGLKVTGGGKVNEKVTGGQLVVTLGTHAAAVTVSISSPALKVTGQLSAKAAKKKAGTLRVMVTVTPVNQAGRVLSFTVKNPS